MRDDRWSRLARRARPQLGQFTAEQAGRVGIRPNALARALKQGRIGRVRPGVYEFAGTPDSRRKSMLAALLQAGPRASLSHTSAAWLLELFDVAPIGIEMLFPRGSGRDIPQVTVHTSQTLPPEDIVVRGKFRMTSVARTICDLAAILDDRSLRLVVFDAWRRGLTTPDDIRTCLTRLGRVSGARRLRKVLSLCDPQMTRTRSTREADAVGVLIEHGVPVGQVNYPIRDPRGRLLYELDLAYVRLFLAYELQSKRFHSIAPDRDRDAAKRAALTKWEVKPIPLSMVIHRPQEFAEMVRSDLQERGHPGT